MMIRLASAAAIAALMSTAAIAQSPNAPMTQPAPGAPMAQSTPGQMGPSVRLMTAIPTNGTTVTNYYKQNVYDPSDNKVGDVRDLIVDKDGRITAARWEELHALHGVLLDCNDCACFIVSAIVVLRTTMRSKRCLLKRNGPGRETSVDKSSAYQPWRSTAAQWEDRAIVPMNC
jgi:hypothetical protein